MAVEDGVVVIAASSGGLGPLRAIASKLPPDFAAPVLVVSHASGDRQTLLPMILSAHGALPAVLARSGRRLTPGRIYVAPGNYHLLVARGRRMRLSRRPQMLLRPSADVLFESAARTYGRKTIAIVLSGRGNDGSKGLEAIRRAGGFTIVQQPEDALFPSMPKSALERLAPDACLPAVAIADVIVRVVGARLPDKGRPPPKRGPPRWTMRDLELDARTANQVNATQRSVRESIRMMEASKAILDRTSLVLAASKRRNARQWDRPSTH